jgi:hypothetical protein
MNESDNDRQLAVEEQLAAEELDAGDFTLLNSLRAHYNERDPVPDGLVERIQFHITLDALNTEVATLTQLDLAAAGARSATTEAVRTITFTSDSLTTMVTLTPLGDGTVRVDGWAAPGAGIRVEVLLADGPHNTYADDDGRFVFEAVPSGLAKFALYVRHDTEFSTVLSPTIEL